MGYRHWEKTVACNLGSRSCSSARATRIAQQFRGLRVTMSREEFSQQQLKDVHDWCIREVSDDRVKVALVELSTKAEEEERIEFSYTLTGGRDWTVEAHTVEEIPTCGNVSGGAMIHNDRINRTPGWIGPGLATMRFWICGLPRNVYGRVVGDNQKRKNFGKA